MDSGELIGALFIIGIIIGIIIGWIRAIIKTFLVVWGVSFGWLYFSILIGAIVLFSTFRKLMIAKKNSFTDEQREELIEYQLEINRRLAKRRIELESRNYPINIEISRLEEQKALCNNNIKNNTVLHPSQLRTSSVFCQSILIRCKVFSLIQYLKDGQADTIKEALLLYNIEEAEIKRQAERKRAEREAQYKQDMFNEKQLELLREQNRQIEKARREQEEANEKIKKQNEELLKKTSEILKNKDQEYKKTLGFTPRVNFLSKQKKNRYNACSFMSYIKIICIRLLCQRNQERF